MRSRAGGRKERGSKKRGRERAAQQRPSERRISGMDRRSKQRERAHSAYPSRPISRVGRRWAGVCGRRGAGHRSHTTREKTKRSKRIEVELVVCAAPTASHGSGARRLGQRLLGGPGGGGCRGTGHRPVGRLLDLDCRGDHQVALVAHSDRLLKVHARHSNLLTRTLSAKDQATAPCVRVVSVRVTSCVTGSKASAYQWRQWCR